jgi:hypothetical protein
MATERQIAANRANAAKSTGPVTPEGKRISSQNASLRRLLSSAVALKGESMRRYNAFAAALIFQFQPRNAAETALIQTMALARWRVLCMRRIQTAALRREIARVRRDHPPGAPLATLIAIAFRTLAEEDPAEPGSIVRASVLESHYDREYHRALAKLLKVREIPLPAQLSGETGDCDFQTEANFKTVSAPLSEEDLIHKK